MGWHGEVCAFLIKTAFQKLTTTKELQGVLGTYNGKIKADIFKCLRWALSGKSRGLEVPHIVECLGVQRTKARIDEALAYLKSQD